ncbi:MAG: ribokinase, partial [Rhodospirillaceae bacterium]|nr:ribokinase [Rhodospirillaceae bacterium]
PGYATSPGGKGANQALAAARAGAAVRMVGRVGLDPFAAPALAALEAAGVDLSATRRGETATGCAIVCVEDSGENLIVVAAGANGAVSADQVPDAWLRPGTVLLLQMEVPHAENWRLVERARRSGARILLNVAPSAPVPEVALMALSWLVVNESEALAVARGLGWAGSDPLAAAEAIAAAGGVATVVTLGRDGAAAFAAGEAWRVGALPIDPVDTTGAGDAFVGVFAAAMAEGADLPASLRRASVAAGLACLVPGAQPSLPDAGAVAARLPQLPPPAPLRARR